MKNYFLVMFACIISVLLAFHAKNQLLYANNGSTSQSSIEEQIIRQLPSNIMAYPLPTRIFLIKEKLNQGLRLLVDQLPLLLNIAIVLQDIEIVEYCINNRATFASNTDKLLSSKNDLGLNPLQFARMTYFNGNTKPSREALEIIQLLRGYTPVSEQVLTTQIKDTSRCPICLEDFYPEEKNVLKLCTKNHGIHPACFTEYQQHSPHKTCPVCREPLHVIYP